MEMRFATDVFGDMPLFIGDNLKGIFSYDSYLELLDKYEVLPDGTAYDEIPFEEFMSIVRQMLLHLMAQLIKSTGSLYLWSCQ